MTKDFTLPNCPRCQSQAIITNGSIHTGQQQYRCKTCGRQCILNPAKKYIDTKTKELIDRLLPERISRLGIARAV